MNDPRTPNLFIVGAPKCGTTSLHAVLAQHPAIYMSRLKEPRFFTNDERWHKGAAWYLNKYFKGAEKFQIRGESTPTTMYWYEKTIPRVKTLLNGAEAKFIILLRNPIDRAYSHYWYNVQTKVAHPEDLSFEQALEAEMERSADPKLIEDGVLSYSYVATGMYRKQVEAFISAFGSDNVLVLLFEDILPDRFNTTIQKIEDHLGVERLELFMVKDNASHKFKNKRVQKFVRFLKPLREVVNPYIPKGISNLLRGQFITKNKEAFKYPPISAETRQRLSAIYSPEISELSSLIGRDLSHWK